MTALPIVDQAQHPPPPHQPGVKERALAELWPIARARVDSLKHWRETLALRRRFSLRMLRLGELKVAIPQGQTPDCESCVEICCTGPNAIVSLRLRDIAALVDAGLDKYIVPATGERTPLVGKERRRATWARRELDDSVFHRAFPVLARDATQTCALLTEDRMCGAFPAWPLSCARYPYALDLQLKTVFYAKSCRSTQVLPSGEAPLKVRELMLAVVDAYNERVKDAVLVHMARRELRDLGLAQHLDWNAVGWR